MDGWGVKCDLLECFECRSSTLAALRNKLLLPHLTFQLMNRIVKLIYRTRTYWYVRYVNRSFVDWWWQDRLSPLAVTTDDEYTLQGGVCLWIWSCRKPRIRLSRPGCTAEFEQPYQRPPLLGRCGDQSQGFIKYATKRELQDLAGIGVSWSCQCTNARAFPKR